MASRQKLTVALLSFFTVSTTIALLADDATNQPTKVKVEAYKCELQSERSEVLKRRFEVLTDSHRHGDTSLDALLNAEYDFLNAQLQCCVTQSERRELLGRIFKNRNRIEEYRATAFDQATGSEADLLVARADTLHARIAIARELPPRSIVIKDSE
ncbi:hypothetical protein [Stieleria varia]|uniref:Outer membrane efflux protein n=1 Tax=Stieleria varia TaxID=2528005 RepID=A0A5C6B7K5_9BACT|nr:hypothetical protein [Stieleria varia]TWU07787.1 hypothetical protein Pla52n_03610 [Stieleria varia]